ncbi:MAG: peptidoglycan-binding protein LysM [Flavobacteriales bacterium]
MGLFSFIKDAGSKLFGLDEEKTTPAVTETTVEETVVTPNYDEAINGLKSNISELGLEVEDLDICISESVATLTGKTKDQETKEKVILVVGNTAGISAVDDFIEVEEPQPEARFHTVEKGDSLSKIAKTVYGNAMKYPVIFEANKPMLSHPDKIYPGQVLRIPEL